MELLTVKRAQDTSWTTWSFLVVDQLIKGRYILHRVSPVKLTVTQANQIRSVAQSCPTLRDPMNCSTPGLPVHHQLPEFTETHIHRVSDAIQPSHPLSSPKPLAWFKCQSIVPSPPGPNPSQHQSLFQ